MGALIPILNLLTQAAPGIAQLIMLIKDNSGNVAVVTLLDQADANFDANQKQIQDWFAQHPNLKQQ